MDEVKTKYYVICLWWLSFGVATKGCNLGVSKWLALLLHTMGWSYANYKC